MWSLDLLRPAPVAEAVPEALIGETYRRRRMQQQCAFIDDRPENVQSAIDLGMTGILFQNAAELCANLREAGLPITSS